MHLSVAVGAAVGATVGDLVGALVGAFVGALVGVFVGTVPGIAVGAAVGFAFDVGHGAHSTFTWLPTGLSHSRHSPATPPTQASEPQRSSLSPTW